MTDLELALQLADTADALTTDRFRALDLDVDRKPDRTPVTDADLAVEDAVRAVLAEQRPGDEVAGEERGGEATGPRAWVLDPIDGTKNFLRGVPAWATLIALVQDGTHMFNFTNLRMTETSEESKMLNMDPTPKVIISASGMCDAGRIRHHLKHNLWRPECTVVFVGYQGEGTLGRTLLEGVKSVKLFGEEIAVHAQIVNFQGLSSHADRNHLLSWIQAIQAPKPQHVFVVHGDREVAPFFAKTIQGLGFTAHAPQYTEVYDLIADKVTEPGYLPERKARTTGGMRASAAYERLVAVGNMLMESIKRSRGRDNKSLARFADQLRQLLEKWES